jgi:cell division protein FtsB
MARKRNRVSHGKEAFYVICIMVFLLIASFAYLGPGGWREMKQSQAELEIHRQRADSMNKENQQQMDKIKLLRSDDATIEGYARRKGYAKKGEIIQEIPSGKK